MSGLSTRYMRTLEKNAEYLGISPIQLMENAGASVAVEIRKRFNPPSSVIIYSGTGGNGGDGMVAARHLAALGFNVSLILVGDPNRIRNEATKRNWEILRRLRSSVEIQIIEDASQITKTDHEVIVDSLLGTGVEGELREPISSVVKIINDGQGFKISVDIASGIDSDTGEIRGDYVKPDLTVTFHAPKIGMKKVYDLLGEVVVGGIGIPPEADRLCGPGDLLLLDQSRPSDAHKGMFGRLLVIGGSETYSGAPYFVGEAAFRTGVDLVHIAAPSLTGYVIASMSPNLIVHKMGGDHINQDNIDLVEKLLDRATGVVLGPGLGLHEETIEACKKITGLVQQLNLPMLLDADGLKALAGHEFDKDSSVVLTPHSGEYQIITGEEPPKDIGERVEHVKKTSKRLHATILLKGPIDVISDGLRIKMNDTGNPGMTVGGTGDTLSGIVGAFLTRGVDPFVAASCGAFINGAAGDLAVAERGFHIVPTDIIESIPKVMEDPMKHLKVRENARNT